jgi:hypothetical protein
MHEVRYITGTCMQACGEQGSRCRRQPAGTLARIAVHSATLEEGRDSVRRCSRAAAVVRTVDSAGCWGEAIASPLAIQLSAVSCIICAVCSSLRAFTAMLLDLPMHILSLKLVACIHCGECRTVCTALGEPCRPGSLLTGALPSSMRPS